MSIVAVDQLEERFRLDELKEKKRQEKKKSSASLRGYLDSCTSCAQVQYGQGVSCSNCNKRYCSMDCKIQDMIQHKKKECINEDQGLHVYSYVGSMREEERTQFLKSMSKLEAPQPPNIVIPDNTILCEALHLCSSLPEAYWFQNLPAIFDDPKYFEQITEPISLAEMQKMAQNGAYKTWAAFLGECDVVVRNAEKYNGAKSAVAEQGRFLMQSLKKMLWCKMCTGCCKLFRGKLNICVVCRDRRCSKCGPCFCPYWNEYWTLMKVIYENDQQPQPSEQQHHEQSSCFSDDTVTVDKFKQMIESVPPEYSGVMTQILAESIPPFSQDGEDTLFMEIPEEKMQPLYQRISILT